MGNSEMQLRTRAKVLRTSEGKALGIEFRFGPIHVFVIANLPEENGNEEGPLAYIKIDLRTSQDWEEHSVESLPRRRR